MNIKGTAQCHKETKKLKKLLSKHTFQVKMQNKDKNLNKTTFNHAL